MLNVSKKYLLLISGILWSGVGLFLNILAFNWFLKVDSHYSFMLPAEGLFIGLMIAVFGLNRVMQKNSSRIMSLPESSHILHFQAKKSYLLVAVMMTMGIVIRNTNLLPQIFKIPSYIAMGTGLFLTSFGYFKKFFQFNID